MENNRSILVENWKSIGFQTNDGSITVETRKLHSKEQFHGIAKKLIKLLRKELGHGKKTLRL